MISGSFDIVPSAVGFAGQLCTFSWSSSGAEYATLDSVGRVPPNGTRLVYVANPQTYNMVFSDTVNTLTVSKAVTVGSDPARNIRQDYQGDTLIVDVVRSVQPTAFNTQRPPYGGTPAFIIASYDIPEVIVSLLSGDDLGVL